MSGQLPFIPTTLPPGLYELASDKPLPGTAVASHTTGNSGTFSPSSPSKFPSTSGSGVVQSQVTGRSVQPQYTGPPVQRQFTGQLTQNLTGSKSGPTRNAPALGPFSPVSAAPPQPTWDVTPAEKASADKHFDGLDKQKRGYVESDVVVPFMLRSNLPESDLASIWLALFFCSFPLCRLTTMYRDLADLNNDGRLTRDGFAVAFHLIQGRVNRNEIPSTLPDSLMPPSMRAAAVPTSSPFQQPPSGLLNDLLWDDSPVASHAQSSILQPQRTGPLSQSSAISAASQTQGQSAFGMSHSPIRGAGVHG
jgi:epidermal growth factor receptor substrate 15